MTSTRKTHRSTILRLEPLEARTAPAVLVNPRTLNYRDTDGDIVQVSFNKPILTAGNADSIFRIAGGGVDGSIWTAQIVQRIDLTSAPEGMSVTAKVLLPIGNGKADIGWIRADGRDLASVNIQGDLGRVTAGNTVGRTPGLGSLTVHSLGVRGTSTQESGGTITSRITGPVGSVRVLGDWYDATLQVVDPGYEGHGRIGSITVGGNLTRASTHGAQIDAAGNVGPITIKGDFVGGAGDSYEGQIYVSGSIRAVTIGGAMVGGSGRGSGSITAVGSIGPVTIGRSIRGGSGQSSGSITATGNLGPVKIGGDLQGGHGMGSGTLGASSITDFESWDEPLVGGNIVSVTIAGSLLGGTNWGSGNIWAHNTIGPVRVGGIIRGGIGDESAMIVAHGKEVETAKGWVFQGGRIASVWVGGTVSGADAGHMSASLVAGDLIGPVTIGGEWLGSSAVIGYFPPSYGGSWSDVHETGGRGIITRISVRRFGGSPTAGDSFRILGKHIVSVQEGGAAVPLQRGPGNDDRALGIYGDFRLVELP